MMGFGEDGEEGIVVGFVFGGREVRREDVSCSAVDDEAGCYRRDGLRLLVFHCWELILGMVHGYEGVGE